MEEWLQNRTDITDRTKKSYTSFLHSFRRHFNGDPKEHTVEEMLVHLNKMTPTTRGKVLNMLSKYTGNKEYSKMIGEINKTEFKRQAEERPHFNVSILELQILIEQKTIPGSLERLIYYLVTDFPALRTQDYHSLTLGKKGINFIDKQFTKITFTQLCKEKNYNNISYDLPEKYKQFIKSFRGKNKITEMDLASFSTHFNNFNKKLGIPRGLSMFRSLIYDQMTPEQIELFKHMENVAKKQNHSLNMAINHYFPQNSTEQDLR